MSDSRIEDLRRRVQRDPSSIAFAQLAEEYRRAGYFQDAIDVCYDGLVRHPGYASARVTLGRALIQLDRLDEAKVELERALQTAPDNLAAIRGLAHIHQRRGLLDDALAQYRAALLLAPNDPELGQTIMQLSREIASREASISSSTAADEHDRAARTVAALEHWLDAIHVARTDSGA